MNWYHRLKHYLNLSNSLSIKIRKYTILPRTTEPLAILRTDNRGDFIRKLGKAKQTKKTTSSRSHFLTTVIPGLLTKMLRQQIESVNCSPEFVRGSNLRFSKREYFLEWCCYWKYGLFLFYMHAICLPEELFYNDIIGGRGSSRCKFK